ncbi:MAG: ribosomal protein S18-alanine N-acetyltransferase [Gammaproteobacteria bacterium]|nr:ribosomal protein S18-alanine N-acetyltransferase [Gammaproteobacteria bacterium]MBU2059738.1 ribosomal protein S18-alanine N-acetyltransferase [Gammaproteobacteria bacterium]MBU2175482.1 ribosomal protein S18-alanine N-acetyltransferase [Gammaproteobacteria bacterium]MBU2245610.1 ribosomal protein S18-alanine N-acetyltransferase [Gammaproteobacteria bacterium]MBU2342795.1 ribosomal protein S18-alanine N-acetyltransferase [Gammaproteobacteria bacterium]
MPLIRSATPADIPAMLQIEQAANSHPWSEGTFSTCFGERYFNAVLMDDNDEVIGFYIGEKVAVEASLFNIGLLPEAQGKGYGQQLLQHFIAQAQDLGALDCWLEVRQSNANAIKLYEKCGFIQTGLRPGYYPTATGREDAILMALPLG